MPSLPHAFHSQEMRVVDVPVYDFTTHQRSSETRRVRCGQMSASPGKASWPGDAQMHVSACRSLLPTW